jgi:hypothetical protein
MLDIELGNMVGFKDFTSSNLSEEAPSYIPPTREAPPYVPPTGEAPPYTPLTGEAPPYTPPTREAPPYTPLTGEAHPYIPPTGEAEIIHDVPLPNISRQCSHFENCSRSHCTLLHDRIWYKKENHYLRIYNENYKEVDLITKHRIRSFPKLISLYNEQLKYHNAICEAAKYYAEQSINDVSFLTINLYSQMKKKQVKQNTVESFPKTYKDESFVKQKTEHYNHNEHVPNDYVSKYYSGDTLRKLQIGDYIPKNSSQEDTTFTPYTEHKPRRGKFVLNTNRTGRDYNKEAWREFGENLKD